MIDIRVFNGSDFCFNPSTPFVIGKDLILQQYIMILRDVMGSYLNKRISSEKEGERIANDIISITNSKCRTLNDFKTSTIKDLDILDEKRYMVITINVSIGDTESEVTVG